MRAFLAVERVFTLLLETLNRCRCLVAECGVAGAAGIVHDLFRRAEAPLVLRVSAPLIAELAAAGGVGEAVSTRGNTLCIFCAMRCSWIRLPIEAWGMGQAGFDLLVIMPRSRNNLKG